MKTRILPIAIIASMAFFNAEAQTTADFGVKNSKYVYEQNFNSLPDTNTVVGGSITTNYYTYVNAGSEGTLTIPGWYVSTANATPSYTTGLKCDDGSWFTGTSIFSYGSLTAKLGGTGDTNRTLGAIAGKNGWSYVGVLLKNNTGSTVNRLTVKFAGETWRIGCESNKDSSYLICDITYNPTFTEKISYYITPDYIQKGTAIEGLDYQSALTGAANATAQSATGLNVDGHAANNRTIKSYTFTNMGWPANSELLIRWSLNTVPYNTKKDVYAQWGLGIDDFSATIEDVFPTDIKEEAVNTFKVYKNGQSLCINGEAGEMVEIYNTLGSLVGKISLSGKEETVSGLNKGGLYVLRSKNSTVKVVY